MKDLACRVGRRVTLGSERHIDRLSSCHGYLRSVDIKGRLHQDHLIARRKQTLQSTIQGVGTTHSRCNLRRRVDIPTPALAMVFCQYSRERQMRITPGVLVGVSTFRGIHRAAHGVLAKERRIPVGKSLTEIDGLVLHGKGRKLVPDCRAVEAFQAGGEGRQRCRSSSMERYPKKGPHSKGCDAAERQCGRQGSRDHLGDSMECSGASGMGMSTSSGHRCQRNAEQ